ncbi:MAG: ferrous iron transport protein B [Planctomycetes bacterium]|nr:ferrous iron transport protein B [Planctomycetota bacterium]
MSAPAVAMPVVALVGRANSGKTSVLMHLTGTRQRPVNFPGTSVERVEKEAVHDGQRFRVVDLPGIASLQSLSPDEQVTLDYLHGRQGPGPDRLCVVLDASKLGVELRLLQQLRELGPPIVVALTKLDVAAAEGRPVAVDALRRALGLPLYEVNARTGGGCADLLQALVAPVVPAAAVTAAADGVRLAAQVQPQRRGGGSRTDRLDAVLLHPLLGPAVLLLVLFSTFQLVFTVAEPFMAWIEMAQGALAGACEASLPGGAARSFLVDGLINGVGSALMFVPQIALLIAFVTVLEGSGYLARAVFLLDRLLRKVGLTGKSFVPLASSFACAIPGILAARIITDERDRLATIAVAPLMSCSARLPVYVVLLAAFFPAHQAGLLLLALYLLGIVAAFVVAWVLRRTLLRGGTSVLAMELPVYQRPSLRAVLAQVWLAVRSFLVTAGTVIVIATLVVWLFSWFPRPAAIHERYEVQRMAAPAGEAGDAERARLDAHEAAEYLEQSWLARIGKTVQPVFAPAGFDWRTTVGILAAFPARELVVPTLGTLHSLGPVEPDDAAPDPSLAAALRRSMDGRTALALMAFFALCSQCAATLAAIRRESHSWFWPVLTFSYMTVLAWVVAVLIQQLGRLLGIGG